MNGTVAFTGGARLGWVQATWPFGRLSIAPGQLTISVRHSALRACSSAGAQTRSIGIRGRAVSAAPAAGRRVLYRGTNVADAVL